MRIKNEAGEEEARRERQQKDCDEAEIHLTESPDWRIKPSIICPRFLLRRTNTNDGARWKKNHFMSPKFCCYCFSRPPESSIQTNFFSNAKSSASRARLKLNTFQRNEAQKIFTFTHSHIIITVVTYILYDIRSKRTLKYRKKKALTYNLFFIYTLFHVG